MYNTDFVQIWYTLYSGNISSCAALFSFYKQESIQDTH